MSNGSESTYQMPTPLFATCYAILDSRLQEVEQVGYPWHHEHGLVGMEGSHDPVYGILWSENWQQEWEPGGEGYVSTHLYRISSLLHGNIEHQERIMM